MRILRAENYRRMPWKNGGGETAEIAVSPEGAGLEDFEWRISMARVDAGGPFSVFPDVDRTLSVLEGEGIMLSIADRRPERLTGASAPYSFPGDVAANADLVAGPITDLNVMARRGRYRHRVIVHQVEEAKDLSFNGTQALLFCPSLDLRVRANAFDERLARFDAVILKDPQTALRIVGRGQIFVIELDRLP
ncbi:HutD family protein [Mesorhizobium sp. KR9-304]|uniref:HutD/Ves family protein n=1 Tax=Mesorhizobium sp. KR9-304 TaxID=3156614 RepID=UPI0032B5D96E